MRSYEKHVAAKSDYYTYTASATAKRIFFYPLHVGLFYYEPNYYIKRNSFDNFLILYIKKGSCVLYIDDNEHIITSGKLALVDCYLPHGYGSPNEWEALWLHFDGPLAREYYSHITNTIGNIILPQNKRIIEYSLNKIYTTFRNGLPIREMVMSKYVTDILTEIMLSSFKTNSPKNQMAVIDDTISYINENFSKILTLDILAKRVALSPFYFTRIFKSETGMTPYQYILTTRINAAKYLLKSTSLSVKEIGFSCGFLSESNFCTTFKKREKVTPSEYRCLDN